jgi:hypothetical protein
VPAREHPLAGTWTVDLSKAVAILTLMVTATACDAASPTPTTGLTGVVVRGPVTPVCTIERPCDAPFSADFIVEQNGQRVNHFRSDTEGRFIVMLAPGRYRIVPDAGAPIIAPQSQAKTVDVLPVGLTQVRLEFDTGIR